MKPNPRFSLPDTGSSRAVTLSSCLKKALKDVEVDKTKHLKEKFLADLRKTREKYKGNVNIGEWY